MPAPLAIPLITAGAGVLSSGINAASTAGTNAASRQHAMMMYGQQRKDALSDYNMMNEYNSPSAQMQRLKEAGLNPNLVYGNGAATQDAAPVRQSTAQSWNPTPPQFDLGSIASNSLNQYYNLQNIQAQTDNLKQQNDVLLQDKFLKAAQTLNTLSTHKTQDFDLGLKQELKDVSIDAAKLGVESQRANITTMLDRNDREAAQNAATLKQAAENILTSRLQRAKTNVEIAHIQETIRNLRKSGILSDLDAELKRQSINLRSSGLLESDSLPARLLKKLLDGNGILPSTGLPGSTGNSKADSIMRNFRAPGIPRNLPFFK